LGASTIFCADSFSLQILIVPTDTISNSVRYLAMDENMKSAEKRDIIVIGGSTGSGAVLQQLLSDLPGDLAASVFVATHIPAHATSFLAEMLDASANMPVTRALDGQPIERGHIYVAAPDRHLLLIDGTIRLGEGPRENMSRPSIDPLFRSAALSYGPRAVGVVLTGMLNDGSSGLHAIKACGGTAVVQHPLDAEVDQMPLSALEMVNVDHVASAADLGGLLLSIVNTDAGAGNSPSDDLRLEVEIAAGARLGSYVLRQIATPSPLSCPECHGVLSEVNGARPLRYRCQIGHAHTAETLAANIDEVDEAIRVAMRVMEERVTLVERMAVDARQAGRSAVAELYEARAEEYRRYATTLRDAAVSSLRLGRAPRTQDI
jgi:two-component system chemotaxis response regulator CheB